MEKKNKKLARKVPANVSARSLSMCPLLGRFLSIVVYISIR